MIESSDHSRHTANEIWGVVHKQGEHINTLRTDVAGLKATMSTGFSTLEAQVGELLSHAHRPPDKPDFKGWFAVAIPFAFLVGALLMAVISPIQADILQLQATDVSRSAELAEFHQFRGRELERGRAVDQELARLEREQQEINDEVDGLEKLTAWLQAFTEQSERRLEDVDKHGSRKWVEGRSE